jgi:hypothetical protein
MKNQPPTPSPDIGYGKSIASLVAGALISMVIILANQYLAKPIPSEAVAPAQTVLTFLMVMFVPHDAWQRMTQAFTAALLVGILLVPSGALAQHLQPVKPVAQPNPRITSQEQFTKAINDTISVLNGVIADAQTADTLAKGMNPPDAIASNCHEAVAGFAGGLVAQLNAVATVTLPSPHAITDFQIGRNIFKGIAGGIPQPLAIGCAPLAQDVRLDIVQLMTKIVGVTGLAAMKGLVGIP